MDKKKILGIVAFIVFGFFMVTFANPNDDKTNDPKTNDEEIKEEATEEPTPEEVVEENKVANNTVPTVIPVTAVNNLEPLIVNNTLNELKSSAINELSVYLKTKEFGDDYLTEANDILNKATTNIQKANSNEEINNIVSNTKKELDNLKERENIDKYILLAKKIISDYVIKLDISEKYLDVINLAILDFNNEVAVLKSKQLIDETVDKYKSRLDNIKNLEILNDYKDQAIDMINNHITNLEDYRIAEQELLALMKEEANKNIKSSSNKEEIDEILRKAIIAMDAVKTDYTLYMEETKEVTFLDNNGTKISSIRVYIGQKAKEPEITKEYISNLVTYTFKSWSDDITNIQNDLTVTAQYEVTNVKANLYLFENDNYSTLGVIDLNLNDEIKNNIEFNLNKIISNDINLIPSFTASSLPVLDQNDEFLKYEWYEMKYDNKTGYSIYARKIVDFEALNTALNNAKLEITNYEKAMQLSGTYKTQSTTIINNGITALNNSTKNSVINNIVIDVKQQLNDVLKNIKLSSINSIETQIANYNFSGSYIKKANDIKLAATKEINNATTQVTIEQITNKYLNQLINLNNLFIKIFNVDITSHKFYKLKKLMINNIASDLIVTNVTYVYFLPFNKTKKDTKYTSDRYASSILVDELLFEADQVVIEYTKDNIKYSRLYNVDRGFLSISGLSLVSTTKIK
ncbi:MAG: hypothetical protein PHN42_04975 [Bacilli bacterium]|nr:hypothetical protein [Bacilli bacterium]